MLPLPLSQILDPTLLGLGRLPARATLTPHAGDKNRPAGQSNWRQSLDGQWRFQLVSRPDVAPCDWTAGDTIAAPWRDITVPGVWTRQSTGDEPHYANWRMPFDEQKPPSVPENNPTGLYRTQFDLSEPWMDRHSILHIGGFESLALVWCNGAFIGMAKDSRLPSEFDLSDAVQTGTNQLAIMVLRWCDATWIEDQDHWNHGGLHRSVWIESRTQTHVRDIVIDTDFDPATKLGSANVRVDIDGPSDGYVVTTRLEDSTGQQVCAPQQAPVAQFDTTQSVGRQWKQSYEFSGYAASMALAVEAADAWSAEKPKRYRLITTLKDATGAEVETHQTWIGFTRIETNGRRLRVNGRPIVLIGVNRHDHHPDNGKTLSEADIRAELKTMKRHNINAIRTAHYPNDPVLLDLADELGFYVIDEANVECHARWTEVAQHPAYQVVIIDRTARMIARDRNHPCIIGWSLGNEAGHGPAHDAAAGVARHLDPGRFVHYEGAVSLRLSFPFGRSPETTQQHPSARELAATDVVCPMYPPIDDIVDWARWAENTGGDDRPLLLCEFSHAMGNSNGSIAAYVDAFFAEPALAGGFVWDWRDQGLAEHDENGRFYWAYGGHFGDTPNDANFNINGLVGPDGAPHPALREYMWAARPVTSEWLGDGRVRCENRRVFADTSDLRLQWRLSRDGKTIEAGALSPILQPGETRDLSIPLKADLGGDGEWHMTLQWSLVDATDWAEAGHHVAWDQDLVSGAHVVREPKQQGTSGFSVQGGELFYADDPVFAAPITACVWRAPTDNDGGKPGTRPLFQSKTSEWVRYGLNALSPGEQSVEQTGETLCFTRDWVGHEGETLTHRSEWTLRNHQVQFDETLIVPEAWKDLPRVGIRFELAERLSQLCWYGLGPDENYPDRCGAQTVGLWRSTVADQYHPYVRPQEYGAHEQCRWFQLSDAAGAGFQFTLERPLSFTARPHHDVDLNEAETLAELTARGTTEVHIDAAQRGLGTAACGPDVLSEFLVGPGTHRFRWRLSAIHPD